MSFSEISDSQLKKLLDHWQLKKRMMKLIMEELRKVDAECFRAYLEVFLGMNRKTIFGYMQALISFGMIREEGCYIWCENRCKQLEKEAAVQKSSSENDECT